MADKSYDAIIIGGGHHGTIMAPYLAKAGMKVGVFERLDHLGGGAITEDLPAPGFRGNFCAHFTRFTVIPLTRNSIFEKKVWSTPSRTPEWASMFSDVKFHLIYKIAKTQIRDFPFPHIYVEDVFPDGFYQELLRNLPNNDGYIALADTMRVGTGYSRARLSLFPSDLDKSNISQAQRDFWRRVFDTLGDGEFVACVFDRFRPMIEQRFQSGDAKGRGLKVWHETFLMRDLDTYSLGPHTDNVTKLVSMLFYLPPDDSSSELGTALYLPKDRSFTSEGGPHLEFEDFDHVITVPYAPNVVASFPKTKACFHGVEPVKGANKQRDILFFDLKGKLKD